MSRSTCINSTMEFKPRRSASTITEATGSSDVPQCRYDGDNKPILNVDQLSFSDTRKLAAIRAKEMHHEMVMNTQARFEQGLFPGGYHHVGVRPPHGHLGSMSNWEVTLVDSSWSIIVKNIDRQGVRLMLCCLKGKKNHKEVLKQLKTKARVEKVSDLMSHPLAVHYGRRAVAAVSSLVANVRNDDALMAYVKSDCKMLNAMGFNQEDMQEIALSFTQFMATELENIWDSRLEDAWDTFTSEILQLGLPFVVCLKSEAKHRA